MGNQVIKIGIIGAGQIANNHLSTYQEIDGVEIVAVADIKKEKAQK
ncbi:MAG: Gfo/Idh/MocA family oxidoreductase, partial [Bacillota bacterium]